MLTLLFDAKYLIAQLAITIIVKEGEHNISEVVGELNMSNSPAKKGQKLTRKRVRDRTPGNMLHCPAINWSPSHVVEGQRCVNVVDRIQDLEIKETA